MAGQVLFLTPSFFLRGGHVTPNGRLGHSKTHFIRLRACSNIEGSRHSSNVPHQKEGGKNGQTFIVKALDAVKPVLKLASTNFLPLALISGVIIGLINPVPGCLAQKCSLSKWSTFGIFLISGLMLRSGEMNAAVKAWPAGIFGLASILFFTPFVSMLVLQLKLMPQEFVTGLSIFCCMPTTLSSGVALTQLVGANSALALALTVTSNLLGILTVDLNRTHQAWQLFNIDSNGNFNSFKRFPQTTMNPNSLYAFKVHGSRCWGFYSCKAIVKEPYNDSFGALIARKGVAKFVDRRRQVFSMISSICLSLVPWMQVSGSRTLILTVSPGKFIIAIAIGLCLHFLFLTWNMIMMQTLSVIMRSEGNVFVKKENAQAIMIVASQKTLPVMVAIVEQLGGVLGEAGLLVLPCIAAHINQIIVDSLLVNIWLQRDKVSSHIKEI